MASDERTVLVTGASRGIGKACALALAEPGTFVAVNYRSRQGEAEEVLRAVEKNGARGMLLPCDVADPQAIAEALAALVRQTGRLDVLVNNAGVTADQLSMRMSDQDWIRVLQTNLTGAFYCTRAALRPMLRQRSGRIIMMSSIVGVHGNAGQANYAAAKAGLIGLAKSVALEVASRGITANVVAPGFIETEMTGAMSPEARQAMLSRVPMGRPGTAGEVAALVSFLAGRDSGYITGQVFIIDGGLTT
ncbi:MAG: 3-oxoacyl-[acyl-carrier-protein] reductase [Bacillota bacterium]|nr:3-oxoacyl-[acyl-carrier-protein] reductase [Bacillota bacterium]